MSGRISPSSKNAVEDVSMLSPSPERNMPKRFLKPARPPGKVNYDEAFQSTESSIISSISPKKNFKPSKRSNLGSKDFSKALETTHEYDSTFAQNYQNHARSNFRCRKEVVKNDITFSKAFETTNDQDLTSTRTGETAAAKFRSKKEALKKNATFSQAFETTHEHHSIQLEENPDAKKFRSKMEALKNNATFSKAFETTNDHTLVAQNEKGFRAANFRSKKETAEKNHTFSAAFERSSNCDQTAFSFQKPVAKFKPPNQRLKRNKSNEGTEFSTNWTCSQSSALTSSGESPEGGYAKKYHRGFKPVYKLKSSNQYLEALNDSESKTTLCSENETTLCADDHNLDEIIPERREGPDPAIEFTKSLSAISPILPLRSKNKGHVKTAKEPCFNEKTCGINSKSFKKFQNLVQKEFIQSLTESSHASETAHKHHSVCSEENPAAKRFRSKEEAWKKNATVSETSEKTDDSSNVKVYEEVNSSSNSEGETSDESFFENLSFRSSEATKILKTSNERHSEESLASQKIRSREGAAKKNATLSKHLETAKNHPINLKTSEEVIDISVEFEYEPCDESIFVKNQSSHSPEADISASSTDSESRTTFDSLSQLTPILNKIASEIEEKASTESEAKKPECEEDSQVMLSSESDDDSDDDSVLITPFNKSETLRPSRKKATNFTAHDVSLHLLSKCRRPKKPIPARVLFETIAQEPSVKKSGKGNRNTGRLKRPAYWATNKLYNFVMDTLEKKYNVLTKDVAENFVCDLADIVTKAVRCCDIEERSRLIASLKSYMIELRLVKSDFYFYNFIIEFLPFEFVDVSVPCVIPFSEKLNVMDFQPENLFRNYFK